MNTLNKKAIIFIKSELNKVKIKFSEKENGREGVDFLIDRIPRRSASVVKKESLKT